MSDLKSYVQKLRDVGDNAKDNADYVRLSATEAHTICDLLEKLDMCVAVLLENADCRGDEDCDHCVVTSLLTDCEQIINRGRE